MLGVVNVLKPTGWTSSDVVVKVRWMLRQITGDKNIKVGHLGTLDPAGSGVLPIVFGKATRLFDYFASCDKIYRATFTFGKTTDTLDSYGRLVDTSDNIPTLSDIEKYIPNYIGKISQIPPQYSRIAVDGKRACDVARNGGSVDIKPREIEIYSIDILDYNAPVLTLDIHCAGGTYIRSLCRDLATDLGSLAYMSSIIRLENKGLKIEDSVTLSELEDDFCSHIIPLEKLFENYHFVTLGKKDADKILNGISIKNRGIDGDYILTIDGKIFGICRDENDKVKVIVRLWQ